MLEKFTAMITDTRVGSTALGTGLGGGGAVFLGEILYPEVTDSQRHLYGIALGLDFRKAIADTNEVYQLLDRFFSSSEWVDDEHYFFDIKYHDLSIFPRHPGPIGSRPLLLDYLVSRSCRIIHLNRRNKLGATLSQEVATATGLFHSSQNRAATVKEINLNVGQIIANVAGREAAHEAVKTWLRGYPNVLDIEYEALFLDQTRFDLGAFLRERWGMANIVFAPTLSRVSDARKVAISNCDEIETRLTALGLGGDVAAALDPYRAHLQ